MSIERLFNQRVSEQEFQAALVRILDNEIFQEKPTWLKSIRCASAEEFQNLYTHIVVEIMDYRIHCGFRPVTIHLRVYRKNGDGEKAQLREFYRLREWLKRQPGPQKWILPIDLSDDNRFLEKKFTELIEKAVPGATFFA